MTAGSFYTPVQFYSNHVYYAAATVSATTSATFYVQMRPQNQSAIGESPHIDISANGKATCELIATNGDLPGTGYIYTFYANATANTTQLYLTNVMLKDLTAEGYTAAETTDVATFKAAFLKKRGYPLPVYEAFDTGSLSNVNGVYRLCGKNLLDPSMRESFSTHVYFYRNNGFIAEAGKTYTFSTQNITSGNYVRKYPSGESIFSIYGTSAITFTPTETMYVYFDAYWATAPSGGTSDIPFQLEYGSPATAFESYYDGGSIDCSTAPLNGFDDTVCDEKDYATGERTDKCKEDDFGDLNWFYASDGAYPYMATAPSTPAKKPINNTTVANVLCGVGVSVAAAYIRTQGAYGIAIDDSGLIRFASPSMGTDPAAFKTAMTGKKICYERATPVVTKETPQPLETQYGYNVLEPVSGGVQSAEVDTIFYENIAGYIDKRLNGG